MKQRFFLDLMYDGANYHGWQIQPNSLTIQSRIEMALSTVLKQDISVVGAGRTDTGVHAKQMFAHFDAVTSIDVVSLTHKLNSFLEDEISISRSIKVHQDAHARFDAISRTYNYFIHFNKNPFLKNKSWRYYQSLNVSLMNEAASLLTKFHDFTSFSKLHTQTKTNICRVKYACWKEENEQLVFTIEANRFLRNMVRAIVGTLVAVGEQKISLTDFVSIIESENRKKAGVSVPAHGLYLSKISYPNTIFNGQQ